MPAERLPMRKVREVLRLKYACGVSERVIARSIGVSRSTVAEYLRRAAVTGLAWPIPADLDDAALERRLFMPPGFHAGATQPLPDWNWVHTELRRRGVTLLLLWEEYRADLSRRLRLQPLLRALRRVAADDQRDDAADPRRR